MPFFISSFFRNIYILHGGSKKGIHITHYMTNQFWMLHPAKLKLQQTEIVKSNLVTQHETVNSSSSIFETWIPAT